MSRRTQKNVGIIGLGIIGRRVADNLRRRGFHVFVWNRTPRPYPNFVGSASEVADLCDFVQIFVSDDDALMEMVQQMKRSLSPHHVIMAHSTVAPHTMRAAAEVVHRRGAHFLDAPFTGSKGAAESGELVYYVAGDAAAFRRARPALEASSKEIIEIGEIGQATTIKVATNMVTAATVQAAAEALALVHSSGLSADKFAAAMRSNGSNSGTLAMKLPKMLEGDFEPHFSVKHMLKDVQIAVRLARAHGLRFGATEAARDALLAEADQGRADADYSSMSRAFFPDRAPMQRADDEAEAEEQTLAGLEEPEVVEVVEEEKAVVSDGEDEAPVDAKAVEQEKREADESEPHAGDTKEPPTASQEEDVDKPEQPQEIAEQSTEKPPAADADEKPDAGADSNHPTEAADEREEATGNASEADDALVAAKEAPVDVADAAAEQKETGSAEEAPSKSAAAEAEPNESGATTNDAAERDAAVAAAERASKPEKSPQDFRLQTTLDPEPIAATPTVDSPDEKEATAERRGFFGRMFGRAGDY